MSEYCKVCMSQSHLRASQEQGTQGEKGKAAKLTKQKTISDPEREFTKTTGHLTGYKGYIYKDLYCIIALFDATISIRIYWNAVH